jgi:hypothetical protein
MGKSSPPPPPDYAAAARETAAGDIRNARYATNANRINQNTPYGSLSYQYTPQYDAEGNETGAGWTQNQTLTPQAQETLDKQLALSNQYADVAGIGFKKARASLEDPTLDMSQVPKRAIDVGQTAQQAIMSRLNPQMQQREEQLRAQMANQGIGLGSTAFGREMANYNQGRNDLEMQAALQGISLDQQNRSAALQEQAYIQDRPLNLVNALRSGAQVQSPQFQQFAQQATTRGPDMLGAANAQYGAQMDAYNADQAQQGGLFSGIAGIGMGLAGLPGAGGSMINGAKGLFG